ncbi:hypothetical protein DYU11_23650 [Fibrisoma montanum]|uniref:Uncharacterized protein n=1 Tax=Fibrisoma montanum TaxID=2305895 RepID=A0A418M2P9_9BACT|nr:DUF5990 family protein [Fibrisoma montanum]RIV19915.1 hypothetical protein DYU11_23650 [Fibrisoma montanum]
MPDYTLAIRIILEKPAVGMLYGVQKGSGNSYETLHKQLADSGDLVFNLSLPVKENKDGRLVLHGPLIQGPSTERFLYLDMGSYAGQTNAPASGRLKVPLPEITDQIEQAVRDGRVMVTTIAVTKDKDGSPTTGTVKPFGGWALMKA